MPSLGALLCLASAAAFGAMGIFGKLAYEEGATVGTLLATRFVLAAVLFWLFVSVSGGARQIRTLPRRDIGIALALGAVGYSAQAGGFFAALERLDASLLSLLIYTFPTIVTVAAIALGRERASLRTVAALALASTGLVLVLAGAGAGALDPLGAALGLGAALVYSVYILSSEGVVARVGPLALSTLVCTGAATTLTLGGIATGDLNPGSVSAAGFGWLAALALISTVGAVGLFFAGLQRVGPRPRRFSRPWSRWSPSAWRSSSSASRSARCSSPVERSCWPPSSLCGSPVDSQPSIQVHPKPQLGATSHA